MLRIKNIYFCFFLPFNKEDVLRYDIKYLQEKGYQVKYLNLFKLYFDKQLEQSKEQLEDEIVFETKFELEEFLMAHKSDSIFATDLPLRSKTVWMYKLFTKYSIDYIGLNTRWFPRGLRNKSKKTLLRKLNITYLFKKLTLTIDYELNKRKMKNAFAVLLPNNKSTKYKYVIGKNTKVVYSHSTDCDQLSLSESLDHDNPIVFVDQYFPYHPDLKLYNKVMRLDPQEYYLQMNMFLHKLESRFKRKVVVCAHPRRLLSKQNGFNFPLVFGKTSEYIKSASLVIVHHSTALNYAVIQKIPLCFISIDAFLTDNHDIIIKTLANRLKAPYVNISKLEDISNIEFNVDNEAYTGFLFENIKHSKSSGARFGDQIHSVI